MTPDPPAHFGEHYLVSIDYQKSDGLWVHNFEVYVLVICQHGVNEKDNHGKAAIKVLEAYPNCRINQVTYV